MGLKEGSVMPMTLRCGHQQVMITILHGTQRVACPQCGKTTEISIRINSNDEVSNLSTSWG